MKPRSADHAATRQVAVVEASVSTRVRDEPLEVVREALKKVSCQGRGYAAVRAPVNADRQTLLFYAAQRREGAREVCELLMDVYGVGAAQPDKRGQTALHYLAKTGSVDCVETLISRGCAVDCMDHLVDQSPLFYAARFSSVQMVRKLVAHGANVGFRDRWGQTPLYYVERLDVAEELVRCRPSECCTVDEQGVSPVQHHRHAQREDIAKFLALIAEARSPKDVMTWAVHLHGSGANKAPPAATAYTTSLAKQKDVDGLCRLEDEFVEDHRKFIGDISSTELFNQVGLNPSALVRRATIKSIANSKARSGPVRHYTLKCTYLPPWSGSAQSAMARGRSHAVVGYVYFRLTDGEKDSKATHGGPDSAGRAEALARKAGGPEARIAHVVVSHLKVSRGHQRRGVATLLLAGALHLAEKLHGSLNLTALYLSVLARNKAAIGLYQRLGFVQIGADREHVEWIHMRLALAHPDSTGTSSTQALRSAWLQHTADISSDASTEEVAMRRKRVWEEVKEEEEDEDEEPVAVGQAQTGKLMAAAAGARQTKRPVSTRGDEAAKKGQTPGGKSSTLAGTATAAAARQQQAKRPTLHHLSSEERGSAVSFGTTSTYADSPEGGGGTSLAGFSIASARSTDTSPTVTGMVKLDF